MMKSIDFNSLPAFDNGVTKWYIDTDLNRLIETEQAENLPKLKGIMAFVVKGDDIEDYVLIDDKQNILGHYPYNFEGYGQIEAKIKIIKISKHYDDYERKHDVQPILS